MWHKNYLKPIVHCKDVLSTGCGLLRGMARASHGRVLSHGRTRRPQPHRHGQPGGGLFSSLEHEVGSYGVGIVEVIWLWLHNCSL